MMYSSRSRSGRSPRIMSWLSSLTATGLVTRSCVTSVKRSVQCVDTTLGLAPLIKGGTWQSNDLCRTNHTLTVCPTQNSRQMSLGEKLLTRDKSTSVRRNLLDYGDRIVYEGPAASCAETERRWTRRPNRG